MALDIEAEQSRRWIEKAAPTHPSLIDSAHRVDELLGISNVPMAVWIDETGTLVRPAESASVVPSALRDVEITDDFPDNIRHVLIEAQKIPDHAAAYRAAIADWVARGADSRFALDPDEVISRSRPRAAAEAEAAACFELGLHLFHTVGKPAAVPWWKRAHALDPDNWTYKRQAWTLETTPDGKASDLLQEVSDTYGTTWVDDVVARGGGERYGIEPQL